MGRHVHGGPLTFTLMDAIYQEGPPPNTLCGRAQLSLLAGTRIQIVPSKLPSFLDISTYSGKKILPRLVGPTTLSWSQIQHGDYYTPRLILKTIWEPRVPKHGGGSQRCLRATSPVDEDWTHLPHPSATSGLWKPPPPPLTDS